MQKQNKTNSSKAPAKLMLAKPVIRPRSMHMQAIGDQAQRLLDQRTTDRPKGAPHAKHTSRLTATKLAQARDPNYVFEDQEMPSKSFSDTAAVAAHNSLEARQQAAQQFPSLESVTRPNVDTAAAAYYLNRRPQTLRGWACLENGPLRPIRISGRLAWPVSGLRRVLGIAASA